MKRQMFLFVAVLIAVTSIAQIDALGRRAKKAVESPAAQVSKEVSVLDQIVEQARIIVQATGSKAHKTRATAKVELTKLMKQLDPSVSDIISDDINTIKAIGKTADSKKAGQEAYERLVAAVNSMNAQANVVSTMEEGRNAIDRAPANMKKEVAAEQMQNVKAAQEEAAKAGMMQRVIANVKEGFGNAVDYIFGKEKSKAEIALKAAIGAVVVGGAAYVAYQLTPEGTGEAIKASGKKYWAKGKKAIGQRFGEELTPQEKVAAGEKLTFMERIKVRNAEAEEREAARTAAQQEKEATMWKEFKGTFGYGETPKQSTWSSITGGMSSIAQQTKDFFNRRVYGTTEKERQNAATWANLESYTTE